MSTVSLAQAKTVLSADAETLNREEISFSETSGIKINAEWPFQEDRKIIVFFKSLYAMS